MKLKFVDDLSGARKRFRRRWPKAVAEVLGETFFQVSMKARDGAALFNEHAALLVKFDSIVATATQDAEQLARLSPRERWQQVVGEAARLVEGAKPMRFTARFGRKAFTSYQWLRGTPLELIRKMVGHSPNSRGTEVNYLHMPAESVRNAVLDLDVLADEPK